MASSSGTLYIGVSGNLVRRVIEHKEGKNEKSFSKKYSCNKLVHFEEYDNIETAIRREKQLKKWRREKKQNLIKETNPHWKDLYSEYFGGQ